MMFRTSWIVFARKENKTLCSVSIVWLSSSACPHLCVELLKTREHEALLLVPWMGVRKRLVVFLL